MTISKARRQFRLASNPLAILGQRAGLQFAGDRARALGISRSHLLHVERGAVWPSAELLDRMSAVYHKGIEQLENAAARSREALARRMLEQARFMDND